MTTAILTTRNASDHELAPLLADRWSPRGFDATHEISLDKLHSIVDAARWAPSASNKQPWAFLAARRGTADFDAIVASLSGFNTAWAGRASALVVLLAEPERDGAPLRYAQYDLGQAAAHATVQAAHLGVHAHQMGGFSADALRAGLGVPGHLVPTVVMALGRHDDSDAVPGEIRQRDAAPRARRPLDEVLLRVS